MAIFSNFYVLDIDIHCDINFSKKERNLILSAGKKWAEFTNNWCIFNLYFDLNKLNIDTQKQYEYQLLKVNSKFYFIKDADNNLKNNVVGYCHINDICQKILYIVYDRISGANFETTVMHELGHAIGLGHTKEPGIMFKSIDGHSFTDADLAELYRIYPELSSKT